MHIVALVAGFLLVLVCGIALKMGLSIRANARRELQSHGVTEPLPLAPGVAAVLTAHTLGVIVGAALIIWGWTGF